MAKYRKLSRTSDQRRALLKNQVTALLYNGKIVTTEAKAKEVQKIAEGIIALAVKEKDNFETVTVKAKVARKDKDGKVLLCLPKDRSYSYLPGERRVLQHEPGEHRGPPGGHRFL